MTRRVLLLLDGVEPLQQGRVRKQASSRTKACARWSAIAGPVGRPC